MTPRAFVAVLLAWLRRAVAYEHFEAPEVVAAVRAMAPPDRCPTCGRIW